MAEVRINIALLLLFIGFPTVLLVGTIWLAVSTAGRLRKDPPEVRAKRRGSILLHWAIWIGITGLLVPFWLFFSYWVGMGIGHAPSEEQVAPYWLVLVVFAAIVGYAFSIRALIRSIEDEG